VLKKSFQQSAAQPEGEAPGSCLLNERLLIPKVWLTADC
jgi:hypothetical protein